MEISMESDNTQVLILSSRENLIPADHYKAPSQWQAKWPSDSLLTKAELILVWKLDNHNAWEYSCLGPSKRPVIWNRVASSIQEFD